MYGIPSDMPSQALLGWGSTWIGDGLGIPSVEVFLVLACCVFITLQYRSYHFLSHIRFCFHVLRTISLPANRFNEKSLFQTTGSVQSVSVSNYLLI
ncbi:unnamed protein product [Soboliphyme baturini]|uniref:Secreted protein n=1 Tax=Soboliphyme baturini TaxID=241478 RepID=A0A183IRZ8_9BILA|nr:unnamed protein product [Soboliphyme baturini]